MANLRHISDQSLLKELERREKLRAANPKPSAIPMDQVDWSAVYKGVVAHFDWCHTEDFHDESDNAHYTFEDAMMAVYGENVFKYLNKLKY